MSGIQNNRGLIFDKHRAFSCLIEEKKCVKSPRDGKIQMLLRKDAIPKARHLTRVYLSTIDPFRFLPIVLL